ncbi:YmfQ family protein [Burkholderia cepacia]|uniref:YmfQ family protein n=1 Tax=Burkholderia cepacia TaxID=292 RepID=UPI00075A2FDA|nr:putative phage tail protein [Burkholderia cepacia]KVF22953.1 phage tail protein [Burkholderia cepacia]
MAAPTLLAANFLSAIQALLPRGQVWPRDQDAVQTKALAGLAPSYERNTSRANYLLVDAFPETTYELLPEWELTLGLPDPCAGESPTIQQRRAQVVARFANSGGQSAAYYIGFAAQLGYGITITNFAPFRCGQSTCGQQLGNTDWFFAWRVNAPPATVVRFAAGQSTAGEALGSWNNTVLECEIRALAPAHTIVSFAYGQTGLLDNTFTLDTSSLA